MEHNPVRNTRRRPRRRRRSYLGAGIVTFAAAAPGHRRGGLFPPNGGGTPELSSPTPVVAIPIESLEPTDPSGLGRKIRMSPKRSGRPWSNRATSGTTFRSPMRTQDFLHTACQESGVPLCPGPGGHWAGDSSRT